MYGRFVHFRILLAMIAFASVFVGSISPASANDEGTCEVWTGRTLIDRERCVRTVTCDTESGEICNAVYRWPSGNTTRALIQGGWIEEINGNRAISGGRQQCARSTQTGNTFCFHWN